MYNLNVNVSAAGTAVSHLLAVESTCTTPRTPEILNSLIAMTNPLDGYNFNTSTPKGGTVPQNISYDSNSSTGSTQGENSGGPTTGNNSPPSVQHTCSQLIKAGLKLSIESKRKHSADTDDFLDLDLNTKKIKMNDDDDDLDGSLSPNQGLTPEDEERRRRRRERNKIAATKCRLKKREKTVNLVHESEVLETQNIDLKTQIQELETQRRRLVDMLAMHTPSCMKSTQTDHHYTQQSQQQSQSQSRDGRFIVDDDHCYSPEGPLPPVTSVIDTYNRPASVDTTYHRQPQNSDYCNRPASVDNSYSRYGKPPTIIVEEDNNYSSPSHQLTNLEGGNTTTSNGHLYHYNTQQQCHNYNTSNGSNQNYNNPNMDNGCMA